MSDHHSLVPVQLKPMQKRATRPYRCYHGAHFPNKCAGWFYYCLFSNRTALAKRWPAGVSCNLPTQPKSCHTSVLIGGMVSNRRFESQSELLSVIVAWITGDNQFRYLITATFIGQIIHIVICVESTVDIYLQQWKKKDSHNERLAPKFNVFDSRFLYSRHPNKYNLIIYHNFAPKVLRVNAGVRFEHLLERENLFHNREQLSLFD